MDKAEFSKRLFNQFKGQLSGIERNTIKEIEGRKSRTDADTFKEWLKAEHEKSASSPALDAYDRVLRPTMNTPEGAAANLADLINFDLDGAVDWQKEWNSAAPILTNWQPERSKDWKYKGNFLAYLKGSEADLRARIFARFIEIENGGFGIDIPAMVAEVLKKHPDLSALQLKFEQILFQDYGKAIELARVTSLAHLREKITEGKDGWKTIFLMALNGEMQDEMVEETKARAELSIRFWDSILEKIEERTPTTQSHPLLPFFHNQEVLDLALKAAKETGLINAESRWVHVGEKTHAISVFWRAAVTAGLAKADAPIYKVTPAISEHFGNKFGVNAIDKKKDLADFGETYKELYKALLAIMRP